MNGNHTVFRFAFFSPGHVRWSYRCIGLVAVAVRMSPLLLLCSCPSNEQRNHRLGYCLPLATDRHRGNIVGSSCDTRQNALYARCQTKVENEDGEEQEQAAMNNKKWFSISHAIK